MKKYNSFSAGFTLTELMAVIAIIAILAGIALGAYTRGVERAVFNEGLQNANALVAAADEYYEEYHAYPSGCDYLKGFIGNVLEANSTTISTRNFTYTCNSNNIVAKRVNEQYQLKVYFMADGYKFANGSLKQDACENDAEFCKGMGYKNCSGTVCTK